jgi:hypothetical protein
MDQRIRVDTDLLEKLANEIHQLAGELNSAGDGLLNEISRRIANTEFTELRSAARGDAFAERDRIAGIERELFPEADKLLALSHAFRAVDDEAIGLLTHLLGDSWLGETFLPRFPDVEGFDPFYSSQTRMALTDWVPVYVMGPRGLTARVIREPDRSRHAQFHITGEIVRNIIGMWTDPKTGKKYYVVELEDGEFGYIPVEKLGVPVDLSKVPNREGSFSNGMIVEDSTLPSPWGDQTWPKDWYGKAGTGERHLDNDPVQQNLCLKNMGLKDGNGAPIKGLCETPHKNLCGELSVLASVGETDITKGLSIFANKVPGGLATLQDPGKGTIKDTLMKFYRELGWKAESHSDAMPTPESLATGLADGHKYIFGTRLDTGSGLLTDSSKYAPHWVALTDVFQDPSGQVFVQVYNPYNNREEIYSWDYFARACDCTLRKDDLGSYTYVEAEK